MKKIIYILFVIFVFLSCSKDEETEKRIYTNYYPTEIGKEFIYSVEEINIDADVNIYDTLRYELMEYFESEYTDDEGNTNIRIERKYKNEGDSVWQILNIWYVSVTNNSIEKTEDNFRYKRLSLPLFLNKKWDGNIFNIKSEEIYEVTKIDEAEEIANINYPKVCVVLQNNYENLIEKYYSIEKYAENIGLVYRENINIEQMIPLPGVPYQERIKVGRIYKQELLHLSSL